MSLSNSITKLLNMEEPNLIFSENFIEERKINGKRCINVKIESHKYFKVK